MPNSQGKVIKNWGFLRITFQRKKPPNMQVLLPNSEEKQKNSEFFWQCSRVVGYFSLLEFFMLALLM